MSDIVSSQTEFLIYLFSLHFLFDSLCCKIRVKTECTMIILVRSVLSNNAGAYQSLTSGHRYCVNKYLSVHVEDRTQEHGRHVQFHMDFGLTSWISHSLPCEHDPSDISQIPG